MNELYFFKQRDFTAEHFKKFMFPISTPDLEIIAFIKKLKVQYGLKIVAVSNEESNCLILFHKYQLNVD